MTFAGWCEHCGLRVDVDNAAYPITGWEYSRKQGGANHIGHRERVPNTVAHPHCVDSLVKARQQGGQQESLSL